jgi:hypothetical protein
LAPQNDEDGIMREILNMLSLFMVQLVSVVLFFFFITPSYATTDVTLQWNANEEPDFVGYRLYYKTGSSGNLVLDDYDGSGLIYVGDPYDGQDVDSGFEIIKDELPDPSAEVVTCSLSGLSDGVTYFFLVTAYDSEGLESKASNGVVTIVITSPQDGFYVNANNYTSYMVEGMASAGADDISVKSDSDTIGGPFAADGDGNWSGASDFSSIREGAVSLTAESDESNGITPDPVTGTYDKTAPTSNATAPEYGNTALSITWEASDTTSGVASTELWYKKGSGGNWANTGLDSQTGASGIFSYTPPDGDGTYYFATRSTDNAGNVETGPLGNGNDRTIYDTVAPSVPNMTTDGGNGPGSDYTTTDSSTILAGACAADTVAIYVNGSTDGVTYTPDETSWSYAGTLESGENTFNIIAYDNNNFRPNKPDLYLPSDGEIDVSLTAELKTGDFSDPDTDDTHAKTEWQISKEIDFLSLLLDITSTSHLTSLIVPQSILDEGISYYWRVRFYDDNLAASAWSEPHVFTTLSTSNDTDANGIPDDQEVDSTVDLDGDGIPDLDQPDVIKSVETAVGNGMIGVSLKDSTNVSSIESLKSIDPDTIFDNTNKPEDFPLGIISFRLNVGSVGDTAEVSLHFLGVTEEAEENLEDFLEMARWYKYDSINGWQDYSDYATFDVGRKVVTLQLKDGSYGDADGTANGVIVDPSGLGIGQTMPESSPTPTLELTPTSADEGYGGGCFIATAALGSNAKLSSNPPSVSAAVRYGLIPITTAVAYTPLYVFILLLHNLKSINFLTKK